MTETAAAINATHLGCSITCKNWRRPFAFTDAIGFAVAQTFENEGKVVAAVVAAGDCRIVLNQDDGQLGWVFTSTSTRQADRRPPRGVPRCMRR